MGDRPSDAARPSPDQHQSDTGSNPGGLVTDRLPCWNFSLGWIEQTPPPTIQDLLPQHVLQQCLDLWLATGTNVLYTTVLTMLNDAEEDIGFHHVVAESMQCDIMDRLNTLGIKWRAEEDARMAAESLAVGKEGEAE